MFLAYHAIYIGLLQILLKIALYSAADLRTEPYYTNFFSDQQQVDSKLKAALDRLDHGPQYVPDWPNSDVKFGQVSGVALDNSGNVLAFHRASNVWDGSTFTDRNVYTAIGDPPISQPTILVFNETGDIIDQWGENMFYMPHGITVDPKGNIWVTDVALHQVFKFSPTNKKTPEMVLGEKFVPGSDEAHFCKPSAVAVTEGGDFFVADGYCNTRIVKYAADGARLLQWGRRWGSSPYTLSVPHALALCGARGAELCVADRERGRVACFAAADGRFLAHYRSWLLGERVFGVACSAHNGGELAVVSGADSAGAARALVLSYPGGRALRAPAPPAGLHAPHAVAAGPAGALYVAEIQPYRLHKFAPAPPSAAPQAEPTPAAGPSSIAPVSAVAAEAAGAAGLGAAGAGAAGAGAAALLALLALGAVRARGPRRGSSGGGGGGARRRWDYGASEFKLRRLLERRRFTRVHSDDSEDEPAPMLPPAPPEPASA